MGEFEFDPSQAAGSFYEAPGFDPSGMASFFQNFNWGDMWKSLQSAMQPAGSEGGPPGTPLSGMWNLAGESGLGPMAIGGGASAYPQLEGYLESGLSSLMNKPTLESIQNIMRSTQGRVGSAMDASKNALVESAQVLGDDPQQIMQMLMRLFGGQ